MQVTTRELWALFSLLGTSLRSTSRYNHFHIDPPQQPFKNAHLPDYESSLKGSGTFCDVPHLFVFVIIICASKVNSVHQKPSD